MAPETPSVAILQTDAVPVARLGELAASGVLFAVMDACDEPEVPIRAEEAGKERCVSLYRGAAEENYADFAPYLFQLGTELLEWIAQDFWHKPWGIFAQSDLPLEQVRGHFRRLLTVEGPDGEQAYFRFYDPRVLRLYLPTCTAAELGFVFGGVRALGVSGEGAGATTFWRPADFVRRVSEPVAETVPEARSEPSPASTGPSAPRRFVRAVAEPSSQPGTTATPRQGEEPPVTEQKTRPDVPVEAPQPEAEPLAERPDETPPPLTARKRWVR